MLLDRLHNTCSYGMLIIFLVLLKADPIFFPAQRNNASVSLVFFLVQSSIGKGKIESIVTRHLWVIILYTKGEVIIIWWYMQNMR